MKTSSVRRLLPLTVVALAVLLAACGPTATSGSPAGAPSAGESPTAAAPPASEPNVPAGPAATSGRRCHSGHLRVAVTSDPGGGAAGSFGLRVVFTNTGTGSCTMYGYPGVSFMSGPRGHQVNSPARRSAGSPTTVRLAPGRTAYALLLMVQPGNYAVSSCHPVTIEGFRIYPPDETGPLYAPSRQQACSVPGTGVATIHPVTS